METTPEAVYRIVIPSAFALIIFLSCLRIIFKGDDTRESYKKIIGGLGVFLVAIIADNPYIFLISFFIGGLLIASERFLLTLASILRANRADLKDITKTYREMSGEEIQTKIISDAKQLASEKDKKPPRAAKTPAAKPAALPAVSALEAERAVLDHVRFTVETSLRRERLSLKRFVSIPMAERDFAFDAVAIKPSTNEIRLAIEVRYVDVKQSTSAVTKSITALAERFKSIDIPTVVCVVMNAYDHAMTNKLLELKDKLSDEQFGLAIYEWNSESAEKIQVVNEEELDKKLPPSIW